MHVHSHSLDLLITKSSCDHVKSVFPADSISDHFSVVSEINLSAPVRPRKTIIFRKTTNICMTSFRADILDSSLIKNPKNELHDLCDQYTSVLTSLLDKHGPLQTKKVVEKAPTPWMTSKLLDCKRSCRQLERRWRRSRSGYDRSKYRDYRNLCNRLMTEAKSQYFSNLIDENSEPLAAFGTPLTKFYIERQLQHCRNQIMLSPFVSISQNIFVTKSERSGPIFQIRWMMYHLFRSLK